MAKLLLPCLEDPDFSTTGAIRNPDALVDRDIDGKNRFKGAFPRGLIVDLHGSRPPSDSVHVGSFRVASKRLTELLKSFRVAAGFYRAGLATRKGRTELLPCWFVYPKKHLDCVDRKRSKIKLDEHPRFKGWISEIERLVLRPETVAGQHLFWIAKCWDRVLCVSDEVHDAVIANDITGMCSADPGDYWRQFNLMSAPPRQRAQTTPVPAVRPVATPSPAASHPKDKTSGKPSRSANRSSPWNTLQSKLNVLLPDAYVNFMADYPVELSETKIKFAKPEPLSRRHCYKSPTDVLRRNRDIRKPDAVWTDEGGPWPEQYLAIGDDRTGNYWAIDVTEAKCAVYIYDHEQGTFEKRHHSLDAFAKWLVQYAKKANQSIATDG